MKTCTGCGLEKDFSEFHFDAYHNRYRAQCKKCRVAQMKIYQQTDVAKVKHRRAVLKHRYGITPEQYDEMLEAQGGVCKICKSDTPKGKSKEFFSVDHDHACCPGVRSCGKCVRGLLCLPCNTQVGYFETNQEAVLSYLGLTS